MYYNIECNYKCENCINDVDTCNGCSDMNRDQDNSCMCKIGYLDLEIAECGRCNYKCKSCLNNVDNCNVCFDDTRQNPPVCSCKPGYFNVDG